MKMMQNIGCYNVIRLLGKGGMSEVYEVENVRLGSRHALKLFAYEKDDAEVKERFLTEGRLLARLSHPRIVKVTDFGTDETSGKPYFVMDLVLNERSEMQQLSDVEPGTVDEEMIGRWYDDLREGLAYIHANGVIHRDLKLQNVLIGPDAHAVLTDFGISKIFDAKGDGVQIVDTVKTLVKVKEGRSLVMGSLGYMAPELEMGVATSPQSDYYALGVIIYRLLTGTWCDSRTDVVGTLETYDPVWKRILPKLLHSNPQGRECLSYADEKRQDLEKAEFEWEERWLREKSRGHVARHLARCIAGAVLIFLIGTYLMARRYETQLTALSADNTSLRRKLAVPRFSDVCELPEVSTTNRTQAVFQEKRTRATLVDAWALTHKIFEDLECGKITMDKAISDLEEISKKADSNVMELFSERGEIMRGDFKILPNILKNSVNKIKSIRYDDFLKN